MPDHSSPTLHILADGTLEFLYNDELGPLMELGTTHIQRASTVDPRQENGRVNWYADLKLSEGPLLGPFSTREEALAAETLWLNENFLGKARKPSLDRPQLVALLRQPKTIPQDYSCNQAQALALEKTLDELIIDIFFLDENSLSFTRLQDLCTRKISFPSEISLQVKSTVEGWLAKILQACGGAA